MRVGVGLAANEDVSEHSHVSAAGAAAARAHVAATVLPVAAAAQKWRRLAGVCAGGALS